MSMLEEKSIVVNGHNWQYFEIGEGEPIFLLHGFPDSYLNWQEQAKLFAKRGYKTIAMPLPGYGINDIYSGGSIQIAQAATAISQFISAKTSSKFHLIGHDWGSLICYAIASANSDVRSLSLLAVPPLKALTSNIVSHPSQILNSWYMLFFQISALPEAIISLNNFSFIERLWETWSPDWSIPEQLLENTKKNLRRKSNLRSALAYYRGLADFFNPLWSASRKLLFSQINIPVLILSGVNDGCISHEFAKKLSAYDYPSGITNIAIPNCGHFLHLEKPKQVNTLLCNFIKEN